MTSFCVINSMNFIVYTYILNVEAASHPVKLNDGGVLGLACRLGGLKIKCCRQCRSRCLKIGINLD